MHDPFSAAERIHRSCMRRSGKRIVWIDTDGSIKSLTAGDRYASTLMMSHPARVVGVYDEAADVDDLSEDILWSCKRLGVL